MMARDQKRDQIECLPKLKEASYSLWTAMRSLLLGNLLMYHLHSFEQVVAHYHSAPFLIGADDQTSNMIDTCVLCRPSWIRWVYVLLPSLKQWKWIFLLCKVHNSSRNKLESRPLTCWIADSTFGRTKQLLDCKFRFTSVEPDLKLLLRNQFACISINFLRLNLLLT